MQGGKKSLEPRLCLILYPTIYDYMHKFAGISGCAVAVTKNHQVNVTALKLLEGNSI